MRDLLALRGHDLIDSSHPATPSTYQATLATWRVFGPSAMRERFFDSETGQPY